MKQNNEYLLKSVLLCERTPISSFSFSPGCVRRQTQPSFQFSLQLAVRADIIISQVFFPNKFLSLFSRRSSPCLPAAIRAQSAHRAQLSVPRCGTRRASRCPFNLPTAGSLVIMGLQQSFQKKRLLEERCHTCDLIYMKNEPSAALQDKTEGTRQWQEEHTRCLSSILVKKVLFIVLYCSSFMCESN